MRVSRLELSCVSSGGAAGFLAEESCASANVASRRTAVVRNPRRTFLSRPLFYRLIVAFRLFRALSSITRGETIRRIICGRAGRIPAGHAPADSEQRQGESDPGSAGCASRLSVAMFAVAVLFAMPVVAIPLVAILPRVMAGAASFFGSIPGSEVVAVDCWRAKCRRKNCSCRLFTSLRASRARQPSARLPEESTA